MTYGLDDFNKMKGKMREPEDVVNTTMKALKGKKVIVTDGILCFLQSILIHFISRKAIVKITGRIGEEIWGSK